LRGDTNTPAGQPIERGPLDGASGSGLNRNPGTGVGAVQLGQPLGWSGRGAPSRGDVGKFVADGGIVAGGVGFAWWMRSERIRGSTG
jgi:hypothetical protein